MYLLGQFAHDLLHTPTIGTSLGLLDGERHDAFEIFAILRDQISDNKPYLVVAELRTLQIGLQDSQFALLFLGQFLASTLLIEWYGLFALLNFLLQDV